MVRNRAENRVSGNLPQEAAHHVLEQSYRLSLNKANYHVAENGANCVEALVSGTDVAQPGIIQQDLLNNEDGHRLGELAAGLHDTETEGDDLGCQEEGDGGR